VGGNVYAVSSKSQPQEDTMSRNITTTARRVATVAALVASGGGVLVYAATPVTAAEGPQVRPLRALCQADDGVFFPGRFGEWRCQRARVDGMGVFWAERTVCGEAGRLFFETVDENGETGSWNCAPSSI
jgi:hypothetical protein